MAVYQGEDGQRYWSHRTDMVKRAARQPVRLFQVRERFFGACNIAGAVLGTGSLLLAGAALLLMSMDDVRAVIPAMGACFLPILTNIIMLWLGGRTRRFQGNLRLLRPQPLGYLLFYQGQLLAGATFIGFIWWMTHRPEAGTQPEWWLDVLLGLIIAECVRSSVMHLRGLRRVGKDKDAAS